MALTTKINLNADEIGQAIREYVDRRSPLQAGVAHLRFLPSTQFDKAVIDATVEMHPRQEKQRT